MATQVETNPAGAAARPSGPLQAPPMVSGGLPLVGHTVEFVRDCIGLLERSYKEKGEVAGLKVATMPMVLLTGPEAQEAYFRAPDEQLSAKEPYKFMTPIFGKDIVYDASPAKMNEQLRMLLPALRDKRMRTYSEIIAQEVRRMIAGWGEEGVVDFVDFTRVLTNFTSSHCLLGPEFREEMTEEFADIYHIMERGITTLAYINARLPLPAFRRRDRARARLVEMIGAVIEKRRHNGREGEDFLQTLMDAKYKDGAELSEHEITGMLLAAMFAGHHTSSVTTAWTLLELLRNRAYLARVQAEIERVCGSSGEVSYQALREMPQVEWAVKEALRLHPPLFVLMRMVKGDFEYKQFRIPAGTILMVSPTVAHRDPTVYRDPDRFDPDRYGPEREEDKNGFGYISFGGGRHRCMGNAFAILQIKTIFAILLSEYEFALCGDPILPDYGGAVIGPQQPCRVRYRRRVRPAAGAPQASA
jgi:sterol 14-demethylase